MAESTACGNSHRQSQTLLLQPFPDITVVVCIKIRHAIALKHIVKVDGNDIIQVSVFGVHGDGKSTVVSILIRLKPNLRAVVGVVFHISFWGRVGFSTLP